MSNSIALEQNMEQDLRGSRYLVKRDGERVGGIYETLSGAMRRACRHSRHKQRATAIHERYDFTSKQYVEVGRAEYDDGICVAITGTAKS